MIRVPRSFACRDALCVVKWLVVLVDLFALVIRLLIRGERVGSLRGGAERAVFVVLDGDEATCVSMVAAYEQLLGGAMRGMVLSWGRVGRSRSVLPSDASFDFNVFLLRSSGISCTSIYSCVSP